MGTSGAVNLTVNIAQGAAGTLTQSGALTLTGDLTIDAPNGPTDIDLSTEANDIAGTITVGTATNVRDLLIRNDNGTASVPVLPATGLRDLTLNFPNAAIQIPGIDISGNLDVTAGGDITQGGALLVAGTTALDAGANDITLTDGANDFDDDDTSDAVTITDGTNVSVTDTDAIVLGATGNPIANLVVVAGGAVTQSGAISGTRLHVKTTLTGGAGITLNTGTNDFDQVSLETRDSGDGADDGGAISYDDSDGYDLFTDASGSAGIRTTSTVSLSGGGDLTQTGEVIADGGTTTVDVGANDITLSDVDNDFATVTVNGGAGTVQITDTDDIEMGGTGAAVTSLAVVAGGAVTQSAAVSGTTLHVKTTLDGGAAITLNTFANTFATVSLETRNTLDSADAAGAIVYDDTGGYDLGTDASGSAGIRTSSTVSLSGGGDLIQTGEVIAAGNTTTLTFGGGNDITLVDADNDFATVAVVSGNNVQLIDTNDMAIGGSTISGTFDATATGATLTVSGAVGGPVGETTLNGDDMVITGSINAGGNTVYLLPDTNNTAVSIEGASTFDLSEGELTSITAGLIEVGRDGTPTVTAGAVSVVPGGNADVGGRNITISGTSITVGGGSNTLTSTGTITLLTNGSIQGGNDDGTADVDAGILIMDADGAGGIGSTTTLDASIGTRVDADTTGGNGDIAIDFIGNTDVGTINAGSGDVTLAGTGSIDDDGANTPDIMGGTVNLSGTTLGTVDTIETDATNLIINTSAGNAVITEADDLVIAGVSSVAGNLNLDLNAGNLTQTNTLAVTGTTTLTTTGNITLADAGNDFDDDVPAMPSLLTEESLRIFPSEILTTCALPPLRMHGI